MVAIAHSVEELIALLPDDFLAGGLVVDDFAGPGGWDEGLSLLGVGKVVGVEWDPMACLTRQAAGHWTLQADVAQTSMASLRELVEGYIGSPPCQLFSGAGSGHGRNAMDVLVEAMGEMAAGRDVREQTRLAVAEIVYDSTEPWGIPHAVDHAEWALRQAYNACLVLEPPRRIRELDPTWVALEQVPAVLPLWEELARGLRAMGYRTWVGVLNSADYGVAQTRKRAILMAHVDQAVGPPETTHARDPQPRMFGPELKPWISMAEALGWGMTCEAAPTVTAGGTRSGGPEPFARGGRALLERERAGRWTPKGAR